MNPRYKTTLMITNTTASNGGTVTGSLDTLGYDYVVVNIATSTSDSTSNNLSVCNIAEGDTTSAYTNITGLVGDTDWTVAAANTSSYSLVAQARIDMRGRKRYLKLSASPTTTQTFFAWATLHKGDVDTISAAGVGADALAEV